MNIDDWIINLENAAKHANEVYGFDIATIVLQKYGANSLYSLQNYYYDEVLYDLESMARKD